MLKMEQVKTKLINKMKYALEKNGMFSYEESWYRNLKEKLLNSGLTEKELAAIEDAVVSSFLEKRKE